MKAVVELTLASPLVSSVVLTPERLLIYNDEAARLYDRKHPGALGRALAMTFPDSYPTVAPYYDLAYQGQSVKLENQPLAVGKDDASQVFDAYLTPVRAAGGSIIGVHMCGLEIGARLRAEAALRRGEARRAFQLELNDALRPLRDAKAIWLTGTEALGRYLQADHIAYAENVTDHSFEVTRNNLDGAPQVIGRYPHTDFDPKALAELRKGRPILRSDMQNDRLTARDQRSFLNAGAKASLTVPLIRRMRLGALVEVNYAEAHTFSSEELELVTDVAERTSAAVERSRAEEALRTSEVKYRTLFETMGEGFGIGELLRDATGQAIDWRFLEMNPALQQHFGLDRTANVAVRFSDLFPGRDRSHWLGLFQAVVDTQSAKTFEHYWPPTDCWLAGTATPAGEQRFNLVCEDVSERKRMDSALRASEAKLAAAFESVPMGAAVIDPSGMAIISNAEYRRFLPTGFIPSSDPVRGARWRAWDAKGQALDPQKFPGARALRGEAVVPGHDMLYTDDVGREIWTNVATVPTRDERGKVTGAVIVISDIDGAKRSAEALRRSEERLRQFGEASHDVLWIRDAATFQWEYLTPAFESIYGVDRKAALGGDNMAGWLALVLPEDREHAAESLRRVRDGEWITFQYRIRRPADGGIRWLRNTDFPIKDAQGKVVRIGGIGQDITEVKKIEEALAAAESRQRALVEGIPQLVWRAVGTGQWSWASPQWTEYTGQTETDSHGAGWLEAVHPDDRKSVRDKWAQAMDSGGFEVEYRIRSAQDYRWFHTRATPVRNHAGAIIEWLGTSTDVHELRRLQERQTVLVAELQHRTRNLIALVRSVADKTLRRASNLEAFQENFRDRLDALARVQGLLSRLDDHDRVTFDELVHTEMAALGVLDGAAGRVRIEGPKGVRLRTSTVQTLALAVHELATNAAKYGALRQPSGHLQITWRLETATNGASPWLLIDWRESGVTLPPARKDGTGQGRELIERALPYQLNAKTDYKLLSDGVHCTISIPISASNEGSNGHG